MYSVRFEIAPSDLAPDERERVTAILQEIGQTLAGVPRDNPFWVYSKESAAVLSTGGCTLEYRIDRRTRELVVYRCQRDQPAAEGQLLSAAL